MAEVEGVATDVHVDEDDNPAYPRPRRLFFEPLLASARSPPDFSRCPPTFMHIRDMSIMLPTDPQEALASDQRFVVCVTCNGLKSAVKEGGGVGEVRVVDDMLHFDVTQLNKTRRFYHAYRPPHPHALRLLPASELHSAGPQRLYLEVNLYDEEKWQKGVVVDHPVCVHIDIALDFYVLDEDPAMGLRAYKF